MPACAGMMEGFIGITDRLDTAAVLRPREAEQLFLVTFFQKK
jgi:hypothetical protein